MDILELKLAQDLASVYQDPMFLVFLDLQNSYNTINYGCQLMTLGVYGAGPLM